MTTTGEQLGLLGMARAEQAASETWKDRWEAAIRTLARADEPFTADQVREIAGEPLDHPNAAGAIFNRLAREGVIRHVGMRKSGRAVLHAHRISEWRGTAS